jgi:hypothetical protein
MRAPRSSPPRPCDRRRDLARRGSPERPRGSSPRPYRSSRSTSTWSWDRLGASSSSRSPRADHAAFQGRCDLLADDRGRVVGRPIADLDAVDADALGHVLGPGSDRARPSRSRRGRARRGWPRSLPRQAGMRCANACTSPTRLGAGWKQSWPGGAGGEPGRGADLFSSCENNEPLAIWSSRAAGTRIMPASRQCGT